MAVDTSLWKLVLGSQKADQPRCHRRKHPLPELLVALGHNTNSLWPKATNNSGSGYFRLWHRGCDIARLPRKYRKIHSIFLTHSHCQRTELCTIEALSLVFGVPSLFVWAKIQIVDRSQTHTGVKKGYTILSLNHSSRKCWWTIETSLTKYFRFFGCYKDLTEWQLRKQ